MSCLPVAGEIDGLQFRGIVCTRSNPQKCFVCARQASERLCDFRPKRRGAQCNKPMCVDCAISTGSQDFCAECARKLIKILHPQDRLRIRIEAELQRTRERERNPAYGPSTTNPSRVDP